MKMLIDSGLDVIPTLKQPVLGICLGMQLMCNKPKKYCWFGNFDVDVVKFTSKVKSATNGWNQIII
jgi:glutamine amidotransferase